ncbi:hypothetical protein [Nocardioides sp.]|uniref:hypothetical protein n=1 Tax=Nocardioides sp. TaxID=35761 RepID=UPI001A33CFF9|nr:hypothetical protein [Nocardioides sp.]MBJ7357985.1 hypothetical protein [Nocardioides sp.]
MRLAPAAAVLLLTCLPQGCSEDPYDAYCEVVTDNQAELTRTIDEGGPDVLLRALPVFRELEDAAPDDIRDDWRVVVNGLAALEAALDDAGVDPATYDRDDPPEGVSEAERDRIDAAADDLRTDESEAAFAAVEQQARDVCKTPLWL